MIEEQMATIHKAAYVSLHVRKSNQAAIGLYRHTLGFEEDKVEEKYCEYCTLLAICLLRLLMRKIIRCGWRGRVCDAIEIQQESITQEVYKSYIYT